MATSSICRCTGDTKRDKKTCWFRGTLNQIFKYLKLQYNERNCQDVNQDGYGDIVVGAPGMGSNSGSAYVVFGGATFSEASYNIETIGAEGSYKLVAPTDEGYGGYSVAGAGER